MEVPMQSVLPFRFTCEEIIVIPHDQQIVIGMKNTSQETLLKAEKIAIRILELLPHTPFNAFGINFGFIEQDPRKELLSIFSLVDNCEIITKDYEIKNTDVKRSLNIDGGTLNLTHSFENDKSAVKIHFNYHYETESASAACSIMRSKVNTCFEHATTFLKNVYGLEIDAEVN